MDESIDRREIGAFGERMARDAYQKAGFTVVAGNWHYRRMGEIDLILQNSAQESIPLLIFCEVKLRTDPSFAPASLAVNRRKQNRIRRLAQCFLMEYPVFERHQVQFDVCEVTAHDSGGYQVNIISNAF